MSIVRDLKNSTRTIRRATEVPIVKTCWSPSKMNSTPEQTNKPMMLHSNPLPSLNVTRKKLELAGRSFTDCDIDVLFGFFRCHSRIYHCGSPLVVIAMKPKGRLEENCWDESLMTFFRARTLNNIKNCTRHLLFLANRRRNASAKTVCQPSEPALVGSTHLFSGH